MAKHDRQIIGKFLGVIAIAIALSIHLYYLLHTTFVDWPEMILFPWFLTKNLVYYRDVALAYAPGANYLLHALYLVLGYSVASERVIAYAFIILTDILVYIGAYTLTRSRWASICALFFFILWQPIFSGNTIWYETILAPIYLIAYILVLRYGEKSRLKATLPVGLVLAAATLIKQTAVWYVAAVCLFVWLSRRDKKEGFVHAMGVGLVVVAVNLLVWGYFWFIGAGSEYEFWVFQVLLNFFQGSSMYALAPARNEIILILPAIIPLIVLLVLRRDTRTWLLALFTVASLMAGLPRWALHRLQPMLVFLSLGFGLMCTMVLSKKRTHLILCNTALLLIVVGSWRSYRVFVTLRDPMQPQFFGAEYEKLVTYLRLNAPGHIFILGNYYHLYFGLDERPVVLPWVPLFPVDAEVPGMQKRLITSLEAQQVPYIAYIPFHPDTGYYLNYAPTQLLLYVEEKYEKIGALPVEGGSLYRRK